MVQPVSEGVTKIEPGTLKCVIALRLTEDVLSALRQHVSDENIRAASPDAVLVHTALEPSELRDRLSRATGEESSLLVVEFEKWSGYGPGIDREWLRARGH